MTTLTRPTRPSLSEAAFRRYEPHIAQACSGSFTLDPMLQTPSLKPTSYVSAARDALLAFRTYHYPSVLIPPGYEVERLKVRQVEDGLVEWLNSYEDRLRITKPTHPDASVLIRSGQVVSVRQKDQPQETIRLVDPTIEETGRILSSLASGGMNGFSTLVLASPLCGEVYRGAHPHLDWEPLAEGWWRVT